MSLVLISKMTHDNLKIIQDSIKKNITYKYVNEYLSILDFKYWSFSYEKWAIELYQFNIYFKTYMTESQNFLDPRFSKNQSQLMLGLKMQTEDFYNKTSITQTLGLANLP